MLKRQECKIHAHFTATSHTQTLTNGWCVNFIKLRHKVILTVLVLTYEPHYEKTNNLHMRKQRREADQRLCLRYTDTAIPLLSKSKISSICQSPVLVYPGLCRICSETTLLVFPRGSSFVSTTLTFVHL